MTPKNTEHLVKDVLQAARDEDDYPWTYDQWVSAAVELAKVVKRQKRKITELMEGE